MCFHLFNYSEAAVWPPPSLNLLNFQTIFPLSLHSNIRCSERVLQSRPLAMVISSGSTIPVFGRNITKLLCIHGKIQVFFKPASIFWRKKSTLRRSPCFVSVYVSLPIIARQRFSKYVLTETNTHSIIEELFDPLFSMWCVLLSQIFLFPFVNCLQINFVQTFYFYFHEVRYPHTYILNLFNNFIV